MQSKKAKGMLTSWSSSSTSATTSSLPSSDVSFNNVSLILILRDQTKWSLCSSSRKSFKNRNQKMVTCLLVTKSTKLKCLMMAEEQKEQKLTKSQAYLPFTMAMLSKKILTWLIFTELWLQVQNMLLLHTGNWRNKLILSSVRISFSCPARVKERSERIMRQNWVRCCILHHIRKMSFSSIMTETQALLKLSKWVLMTVEDISNSQPSLHHLHQ